MNCTFLADLAEKTLRVASEWANFLRLMQNKRHTGATAWIVTLSALVLLSFLPSSARAQSRSFGVDVSHFQGSTGISQTSWDAIYAEGKRFTFIKATEGLTGPDDTAMSNNVARATAAGLLAGVYHFAHPENRPTPAGAVQEADHLLAWAGNAVGPGFLRPVLDLELNAATLSTPALTEWVIAFSNEIIARRGAYAAPIIYCDQAFANNELDSRLANYDLWLRTVGTGANPATDDPPGQGFADPTGVFNNWSFWQYSSTGTSGGITPLDLDVCHNEYKPLYSFLIPLGPLIALQNSNLFVPASDLTRNGVPGLTNPVSKYTVTRVATNSAQAGRVILVNTQIWAQRYDNGLTPDGSLKVVTDTNGNVIVTGYSRDPATDYDFLTIKYTSDGTALWTNRLDGAAHGQDVGRFLAVNLAGDVYVAGDSINQSNITHVMTVKYLANGMPAWTNTFSTVVTSNTYPIGLAVHGPTGDAYVLCSDSNGNDDQFITVKYSSAGTAIFTNRFRAPNSNEDEAHDIVVDNGNNVYVTGASRILGSNTVTTLRLPGNGSLGWTNYFTKVGTELGTGLLVDAGTNVIVGSLSRPGSGQLAYITFKYTSAGVPVWTNSLPAPDNANFPVLAVDKTGSVFVVGSTPVTNFNLDTDITSVKLSSAGVPLWTNRFFERASERPFAITTVDPSGNLFVATYSGTNFAGLDFITIKYASDGTAVWTNRYDGPENHRDTPFGIATDLAGNVYVTGSSPGLGTDYDFATVKYGADSILYQPPTNYIGADTFVFSAADNLGNSATALMGVAVVSPVLRFRTNSIQLAGEGFRVRLDGARGTNPVVIDASSDLASWNPLVTNPPVYGSVQVLDPAATNFVRRFYRASQAQ
jgi:GH25 family lysozyme M1 (1,4-beta-N-acetylmuramidase)